VNRAELTIQGWFHSISRPSGNKKKKNSIIGGS